MFMSELIYEANTPEEVILWESRGHWFSFDPTNSGKRKRRNYCVELTILVVSGKNCVLNK